MQDNPKKADKPTWPERTLAARCLMRGVALFGGCCFYVASLGPVLAIAGHVWDRVWPDWFRRTVEVVYGPVLWCEANVSSVHSMIDKYVNWWVGFLDM